MYRRGERLRSPKRRTYFRVGLSQLMPASASVPDFGSLDHPEARLTMISSLLGAKAAETIALSVLTLTLAGVAPFRK